MQQRYPWNGLVDIDYTISGVEGENPLELFVEFAATLPSGPVVPKTFVQCAPCDLPSSNGTFRVTWNAFADCGEVVTTEAKLSAKICYDPVSVNDADYLVIYLDAGKDAESWPVRCVSAADLPSSFFNRDVYKLTRLVLKRVKAGSFWMGTGVGGDGDVTTARSKVDRHYVTLTDDFHFGVFPVTQRQFKLMTGKDSSFFGGKGEALLRPVVYSGGASGDGGSWNYLSGANGKGPIVAMNDKVTDAGGTLLGGFSLPTESQWEYACRAGTTTKFYWGSDVTVLTEYAWAAGNASSTTHPVGLLKPNDWGFYDMLGNAYEWVQDWYGTYPTGTEESPVVNPEPEQGASTTKISRGGCFVDSAPYCGQRYGSRTPATSDIYSGREGAFRVCRKVAR